MLTYLLITAALAATDKKNLGTVTTWPSQCAKKKIYPAGCTATTKSCNSYWMDGVFHPDRCNTITCAYWCEAYTFSMDSEAP